MNSFELYKRHEISYLKKEFKINIIDNINLNEYIDFKRNVFIDKLINRKIPITNRNSTKTLNILDLSVN